MVKQIMMVDDEPDQLYATTTIFYETYGNAYEIIPINSGQECLEYLKNNKAPDLILLDIMMPGLNGWEVQRKLKEHEIWRHIPIVFLTARSDSYSQKVGFSVSADYLIKPISVHDLKNTIDAVLNRQPLEKHPFSELQLDSLQEVVNIGASHAATALSKMVYKYIKIGIPIIDVMQLEKTMDSLKEKDVSFGIYIKIENTLPIYCLLLISEKDAYSLINLLFNEIPMKSDEYLSDMYKSALQEVGNIMICSFLDSIAELLQISLTSGPPYITYDEPTAIFDYILIELGKISDEIVMFNIDLQCDEETPFDISMFLLPEPETIQLILDKVKIE